MKNTVRDSVILSLKINRYREEVHKRNCKNFQVFAFGGMVITFVMLLGVLALSKYTEFIREYFIVWLYMLGMYFFARWCNRCKVKHIMGIFYGVVTPVMLLAILMGTFMDAQKPAFIILILICVMTLFIIDKPWRIALYLAAVACLFLLCSFLAKERSLFIIDMVNQLISYSIAIGANYFTLKDRLESAENYVLLREKSEKDALTTLFNRGTGEKKVQKLVAQNVGGAFIIIDVDDFKDVNDTYGHGMGDVVLCEVSKAIQSSFRKTDIVWRMGGDEFAVFAVDLTEKSRCEERFQALYGSLRKIKVKGAESLDISVSIGCTISEEEGTDFEQLYRVSDEALYKAKREGKGTYFIA